MKRLFIFLSLSIFSILLLTSCGTSKQKTLKVAEVTRSVFYAPQYVAMEKDFFEKEGLSIKLQTTWGGDKTMTTLLSGGVDVALVGSETSIYVYNQGTKDPVINFAKLTQTDGTFLIARNKVATFSFEDLNGSVFLGQRKGGMPQMVGEYVLKKHEIDPHHDLQLIQNIDFQNIANSFASGTGDYVQLFEPQASLFEKEGIGTIVASFGEEATNIPYTVYMAKESYLKENEEDLVRFTRAIYKAEKWVETHSAKEVATVISPYFDDIPFDLLVSSVDRYKKQNSYAKNPLLNEKEWNNLQSIMKEANELKKEAPYLELVDTSISEKAMEN